MKGIKIKYITNSTNMSTIVFKVLNRNIPLYCGACWAHASRARMKIESDRNIAVQAILNYNDLHHPKTDSCEGGTHPRLQKLDNCKCKIEGGENCTN